jgi:hypothetical protein
MPKLDHLSDQELADRLARVDLMLRQMVEWSPKMDKLDELLAQIHAELDARRKGDSHAQ